MAEKFVITGGKPLSGSVLVPGAKNAALKLIAGCLLTPEICVLNNLPVISDVSKMLSILESMGASIERQGGNSVSISCADIKPQEINGTLVSQLRASVVLLGPLLARFGEVRLPYPGGDRIGVRPLDAHMRVFEQLGAQILSWHRILHLRAPKGLVPGRIILPEFSVTATENALLAAALLPGTSEIKIAAAEPHVQDLALFLGHLGVDITGAGTHDIIVSGKPALSGAAHTVIPDALDAATFLICALATRGRVLVEGAREDHLILVLEKLREMGAAISTRKEGIAVSWDKPLRAVGRLQAMPYPGIPSDLQALFTVLATQASGETQIHDPLFEGRFLYLQELARMGAVVEQRDSHRAMVRGPAKLSGTTISSFDIRAGAAMVLAGLVADGETIIEG